VSDQTCGRLVNADILFRVVLPFACLAPLPRPRDNEALKGLRAKLKMTRNRRQQAEVAELPQKIDKLGRILAADPHRFPRPSLRAKDGSKPPLSDDSNGRMLMVRALASINSRCSSRYAAAVEGGRIFNEAEILKLISLGAAAQTADLGRRLPWGGKAMKLEPDALAKAIPPMTEDEFAELVADIEENDLRDPICIYGGKILDGWHRYRAMEELGRSLEETMVFDFDTKVDGKSPEAYVLSRNLHRRHLNLTAVQKAAFVAEILEGLPIAKPGRQSSSDQLSPIGDNYQPSAKEQIKEVAKAAGV
jgi:hypothetical protein